MGLACFDLWRLGLAHSVLPEQLYWLQHEKFTAAAAKIRLKKVFHVDIERRAILSLDYVAQRGCVSTKVENLLLLHAASVL